MERDQPVPSPERETTAPPQVWIASLADYTNGRLHGEWVDATQELAELEAAVQRVLDSSELPDAEEWAVFDYDNFYGLAHELGEYPSLATVSEVAHGLEEHGEPFAVLLSLLGVEEAQQARERFHDYYRGEYDSLTDYAEQTWDDLGYADLLERTLPPEINAWVTVDFDAFGAMLTVESEVVLLDNGHVLVFDTRL